MGLIGRADERLRLTVVASAPAYTRRAGHASSCYVLESGREAIVLDLGHGAFAALGAMRAPESLTAVFISHLHPDHHIDLVAMRHYLRYECEPPATVPLHAPPDLRRRYDVLVGEPGFLDGMPGEELREGVREVGPFTVRAGHVKHSDNSFGFRVARSGSDELPGLVFSGDCGEARDLLAIIRPGDTLLSEATWGVSEAVPEAAHLTARDAGWAAREGRASQLVLTHMLDKVDPVQAVAAAQRVFPGTVRVATPGFQVPIE